MSICQLVVGEKKKKKERLISQHIHKGQGTSLDLAGWGGSGGANARWKLTSADVGAVRQVGRLGVHTQGINSHPMHHLNLTCVS